MKLTKKNRVGLPGNAKKKRRPHNKQMWQFTVLAG